MPTIEEIKDYNDCYSIGNILAEEGEEQLDPNIYENSSSEDEEQTIRRLDRKEPDRLYDEMVDDEDEAWIQKQVQEAEERSGRKTDAILYCPLCFTPICVDCQRHESYKDQYRAMFVTNCIVKQDQILRFENEGNEVYHPVACSECETEIAVFDEDEIYHFFNIVADTPDS